MTKFFAMLKGLWCKRMENWQAKKQVCEAGIRLVQEGLIARTWENISVRTNENQFVITPSGLAYEHLKPENIVDVAIDDLSYKGSLKPSSEKGLHAETYKLRSDVNAVIHTHQANASAVSAAGREVPVLDDDIAKILGWSVRCAAYALPGTKKLKMATAKALEGRNAALLTNHGAVCIGKNLDDTFLVASTLEKVCHAYVAHQFLTRAVGVREFSPSALHQAYLKKYAKR